MTNEEFSHGFDNLLDSYAHVSPFGDTSSLVTVKLDEYEKSFFLSKAQEECVLSIYEGRNALGSFEETEEMRRYLSNLICETVLSPISNSSNIPVGMDSKSKFFTLPDDLWFITYEAVDVTGGRCGGTKSMEVVPVTQDEYHKVKKNPFRGANDRRALRLDLSDGVVEIISKYQVTLYYLRYLKKISPIVLTDLPDELSIDGVGVALECQLHESLHQKILDRAVVLALQSKSYGAGTKEKDSN